MKSRTAAPSVRHRHLVHFHRDPAEQIATVAGFIAEGRSAGSPVIAITELAHSVEFHAALERAGCVPDDSAFELLDAAEVLDQIAPDGPPDPAAFQAAVGSRVRAAAAAGGPRVPYLYGDMVGLLWSTGDVESAIELEGLWNELVDEVTSVLFCGYPSSDSPKTRRAFATVCDLHTAVLGAAPAPRGEVSHRFAMGYASAGEVRRYVADTLRSWGHDHLIGDACLVLSELVTNAVRHARSDMAVALTRLPDALRVAVGDSDPQPPILRYPDPGMPGGRGLRVVDALARDWGSTSVDGGKVVWADLPLDAGTAAAAGAQ